MPSPGAAGRAPGRWARILRIALPAAVFAALLLVRLATASIVNDDYLHLSTAQQVVLGATPVSGFIDPGEFLFYSASAAAQLVERSLLGEVVLDAVFLALGHLLVFVLASRAAQSRPIGLLVTGVAAVLVTRLYSYPKVFLYALGLMLIWRYADRLDRRSLLWVSLGTALAFLFRHDHGVYIGAAMVAMLVLVHWRDGWRTVSNRVLVYGGATVSLLLPFLLFVQIGGGGFSYWQNLLDTARGEYLRTVGERPVFRIDTTGIVPTLQAPPPQVVIWWADGLDERTRAALEDRFRLSSPERRGDGGWEYGMTDRSQANVAAIVRHASVAGTRGLDRETFAVTARVQDPNAVAWFYYLTILMPPVAVLLLALDVHRRRRGAIDGPWPRRAMAHEVPKIATAAVLATIMHMYLLRAASESAIADVSTLTAVLGAWLLARGLHPGIQIVRAIRGSRVAVSGRRQMAWRLLPFAATLVVLGLTLHYTGKVEGAESIRRLAVAIQEGDGNPLLVRLDEFARTAPPYEDDGARYVFDCTLETDRLMVTAAYAPDLYYAAGRGFAAGRLYFLGSLAPAEEFKARSLTWLQRERVPIVMVYPGDYDAFVQGYPALHQYVVDHYREAGEIDFLQARLTVLVDERIPPVRTYGPDSLPCFRAADDAPAG